MYYGLLVLFFANAPEGVPVRPAVFVSDLRDLGGVLQSAYQGDVAEIVVITDPNEYSVRSRLAQLGVKRTVVSQGATFGLKKRKCRAISVSSRVSCLDVV
jgi:hypothetical protein